MANKRRPTKATRQGIFSGLVFCADCGSNLRFAICNSFDGLQDHYHFYGTATATAVWWSGKRYKVQAVGSRTGEKNGLQDLTGFSSRFIRTTSTAPSAIWSCLPSTKQIKSIFDSFAAIIRKYVGITELTLAIVNEFIPKVVVQVPENRWQTFLESGYCLYFAGKIHLPTAPQTEQKKSK